MIAVAPTILCVLLLYISVSPAEAQSLAETYKATAFDPTFQVQRQLEKQQLARSRDPSIIVMVTLYPDPKNALSTAGFFVDAQGMFTEFQDGPMHGNDYGKFHLPTITFEAPKSLLFQLPAPANSNPVTRRLIISFLSDDKWVTWIYDGGKDRDILQAILHVPATNDSGYGSIFSGYKLP